MTYDQILDAEIKALDISLLRYQHGDLVEEFIDRSNVDIPNTFVPSAKYIAVVGNNLLFLVHPVPRYRKRPSCHWVVFERNRLFRTVGQNGYFLSVRRYGETWGIERERLGEGVHEVLGFSFGPTPIFFRRPQWATFVAKACHPCPREEAKALGWIPIET